MADVNRGARPLSPHLQVYRFQWTMLSSILIRITGNALIVATVLLVWWLVAAATSDAAFARADAVLTSWFGDLVLLGSVWALWYHLLGGLKHVVWSTGQGLELRKAEILSKGAIVLSFVLTALTVILAW